MSYAEIARFERMLAYHTAPAMLGVKPANLISVNMNEYEIEANIDRFNRLAAAKGLKIRRLCRVRSRMLLLVYNEKKLLKQLSDEAVCEMFERFGYGKNSDAEQKLEILTKRISETGDFPHEIGLFLGYPTEDINGFIANRGENYLLCGYWKVYSNEERAKRLFNSYNKCRSYIMKKLDSGEDIYKALRIS